MNLSTQYLGLTLPHPLIVGASPICYRLDKVKECEDNGAAALVMHSLFEEQIVNQMSGKEAHIDAHANAFPEATSYFPALDFPLGPETYLDQIAKIKAAVNIPVIASLNGINEGTWVEYARLIEEAGADALEINLYFLPHADSDSSSIIEQRAFQIVRGIRQVVSLPLAVKLSPFFTALPHFVKRLEEAGANAVVLFNRFYQPDIDLEALNTIPTLQLSDSSELLLRLRWLAVLFGRTRLNLSVTGGVHTHFDAIKSVMAGADSVQMVSTLLKNGPQQISKIRSLMEEWMDANEYADLDQMKGSMSYIHNPNPEAIGRGNYMKILQTWRS